MSDIKPMTEVPASLRQYITKSKAGHYSCVLKRRVVREGCRYADPVLRTVFKHSSPQSALAEVLTSLSERVADGRIVL
jgi:hypothetical protein